METLGILNNQNDLEKYKVGGLTLADFKIYCKAIVKAVWFWHIDISSEKIRKWSIAKHHVAIRKCKSKLQ